MNTNSRKHDPLRILQVYLDVTVDVVYLFEMSSYPIFYFVFELIYLNNLVLIEKKIHQNVKNANFCIIQASRS